MSPSLLRERGVHCWDDDLAQENMYSYQRMWKNNP